MKRKAVLEVVEAAYRSAPDRDEWAMAVTNAISSIVPDRISAPYVLWSTLTPEGRQEMESIAGAGATPELLDINRVMHAAAPPAIVQGLWAAHAGVSTLSEALKTVPPDPAFLEMISTLIPDPTFVDSLALNFRGALGRIVTLCVPLAAPRTLGEAERERLLHLVAHVSASERLLPRRQDSVEAVVRADGVVLHAENDAKDARDELREHVLRIERARQEENEENALELWRGMVDGRWSLVDELDSDGKRLFIARENPRDLVAPRALSSREKQVLALVCEGKSNKLIAYDLGLSQPVVSNHIGVILGKLGVGHRAELIDLATTMGALDSR